FICNHCPFVKHIQGAFAKLARDYETKGVAVVGINSNDATAYPDDSPQRMIQEKKAAGYSFPYLCDETQEVAKAYQAACTPDFFIFDKDFKCVYRGRFDDSTPGNSKPVTGNDLNQALESLLVNKPISIEQKPSVGCNIKMKK